MEEKKMDTGTRDVQPASQSVSSVSDSRWRATGMRCAGAVGFIHGCGATAIVSSELACLEMSGSDNSPNAATGPEDRRSLGERVEEDGRGDEGEERRSGEMKLSLQVSIYKAQHQAIRIFALPGWLPSAKNNSRDPVCEPREPRLQQSISKTKGTWLQTTTTPSPTIVHWLGIHSTE